VRKISRAELCDAFSAAGLQRGDTAHVQSNLQRIGSIDAPARREAILEFYLDALRDVLGPEGTISVFTATYALSGNGEPFIREETPSELGAFSEFVRNQPASVRSIHPLASLAALGPRAAELCDGAHREGFGYDSPWGRLHRANAAIVSLGIDLDQPAGTSFVHYVERLYGVPYRYSKVLSVPVIAHGKAVPGPFMLAVRYLDFGIENWTAPFKQRLVADGFARWIPLGGSGVFFARANDFTEECIRRLNADPWCLLKSPPRFVPGRKPCDGMTAETLAKLMPVASVP
jgi:aminoglycoside 3-N-acetyltransferase